jgi:hypothetical protein
MAMLVGVAALAVLVVGCGGGDDSSSEETLTKAQYVNEATAICSQGGKETAKELSVYLKKNNLAQPNEAQAGKAIEVVVLPAFRSQVEELSELQAPEGDEAQIESMLQSLETGLDDGADDPENFFKQADSEFAKGVEMANKYGIEGCGSLF